VCLRRLLSSKPLGKPQISPIPCLPVHRQRQTTGSVLSTLQFKKANFALLTGHKTPDVDLRYSPTAALPREKGPLFTVQEGEWASRPVWTGKEISPPPPGFDPRTVQPIASLYTDWVIRAAYCTVNRVQLRSVFRSSYDWDADRHSRASAPSHTVGQQKYRTRNSIKQKVAAIIAMLSSLS
jgi:hypothetical protein